MAFIIKNPSNRLGGAMIDGKWESVPPGGSISSTVRPTSLSFYVKVFSVPDVAVGGVKEKGLVSTDTGSATLSSDPLAGEGDSSSVSLD